jgi:predicted Zn-dependent protease with MMP-like domain
VTDARPTFDDLVASAIDSIPEELAEKLDNVAVTVEEEPPAELLRKMGLGPGVTLFGVYQGVAKTRRGTHYGNVLPDRIVVFRGPILRACRTDEEIRRQVARTVIHEIAHHFGIGDRRLRELGY